MSMDRALLGKIIDDVFDGALEDASIIEDIYAAIKKHEDTPAPVDRLIVTEGAWQWWAGRSEEWFEVGPEASKDAIIQAATNDSLGETDDDGSWKLSFHIVEARQDPLRIADWLDLDALIERAEDNVADSDRVASENDDGPWFDCTPEQEKDLGQRLARACDEWQAAHGLAFKTATFSHTRNSEHVVVDLAINALAGSPEDVKSEATSDGR